MQYDMHYYGTYAMAAAAGIPEDDAETIAYASQHVDDQNYTSQVSVREVKADLCETVIGIPTAHHPISRQIIAAGIEHLIRKIISFLAHKNKNRSELMGEDDCRLVWVPFHFLPGNKGKLYLEKLVCQEDSKIANEMLENHLKHTSSDFNLELIGIAAHVYADTFAHFGFSGVTSWLNSIDVDSISISDSHGNETRAYIEGRANTFRKLYGNTENALCLGHGGVDTCPDRPFLRWEFRYKDGDQKLETRNNSEHFLLSCQKMHAYFCRFADIRYPGALRKTVINFDSIALAIQEILNFEGPADDRVQQWLLAMQNNQLGPFRPCVKYDNEAWNTELIAALEEKNFTKIRQSNAYRFLAAAEYHRHYVLKQLLPKHGLIVA
ncbi:hypothetical protein K5M36_19120 [Chromobacterium vaccinii]|uniref:DUF6765 family protein n=1 Tax=Chromobacterium piscinae TaxID=686831 RepID=UPI00140C3D90|nr:DUF6765 family protein [Chromobacterium piscinae]MBX9349197.1 hypothetical protein [Chromobacterium vaccinii]MCD4502887.1 hypothetical protein [Chromobacterium piscinae]NHQ81967.1 hypothetical protein [Chromobacterium vaccinii]